MHVVFCVVFLAAAGAAVESSERLSPHLRTLLAVGPNGAGNRRAAEAWQELARSPAERLPDLLAALDGANPLAANWIRTAIDAIAERQLRRGGKLPTAELEQFLLDRRHAPRARRLAYEWLCRADRSAQRRLLGGMLDDPSREIRRDAVARLIGDAVRVAELSEPATALPFYRRAFAAARDRDQVELLAARLRKLGESVDLSRHFGFILRWKLIGPFDNTAERGYDVAYPPEREIEPAASYDGKHGKVAWIDYLGKDDYGKVDLNRAIGEQKGVVGYAMTEFYSGERREAEFRLTSFNAVKLWLNSRLVDEHNIYHGGSQIDQYISRGTLLPGRNTILLKVCQNEQTQSWARVWGFQLRLCDEHGTAVLSTDRPSGPVDAEEHRLPMTEQ